MVIENADSGILTEEIANVTIKNITTKGTNIAHYTVAMAGVHNVLAENIKVFNKAVHPLSFNTFSTKNVYLNCEVFVDPVLDQHSGVNHQNLFDKITLHLTPNKDRSYHYLKVVVQVIGNLHTAHLILFGTLMYRFWEIWIVDLLSF